MGVKIKTTVSSIADYDSNQESILISNTLLGTIGKDYKAEKVHLFSNTIAKTEIPGYSLNIISQSGLTPDKITGIFIDCKKIIKCPTDVEKLVPFNVTLTENGVNFILGTCSQLSLLNTSLLPDEITIDSLEDTILEGEEILLSVIVTAKN